ncbi:MAG: hypothetical protein J0M35_20240 [Candidatus Obscuribacter phosphatis]|uniref:DUF8168 domain-containing protein n=1 Tax=Candidatus Obscuribacter phosphatis TaxID=1906157 RepID=A0A8J7TNE6_9BACT|nr:hypothetical protein [Candidatus Obscuribacter phosphatis]
MVDMAGCKWKSEVSSELGRYHIDIQYPSYEFVAEVRVLDSTDPADVFSLRNLVEKIVRSHIDAVGFLEGFGADIGIFEVTLPSGEVIPLFPNLGIWGEFSSNFPFKDKHIEFLKLVDSSCQLQEALGSFRPAIREHGHTGAFCFRAIEAIKEHFRTDEDFDNGRPVNKLPWEKFNTALVLAPNWTQEIVKFARPQRHGTLKMNLDKERGEMLKRTATVINRFSMFLQSQDGLPLCKEKYPLLECDSQHCLDAIEHRKPKST